MDILRFITAGNVDDGKSTFIGRLLYDTHNIKSDVLQSVSDKGESQGTANDSGNVNLAHITDGLRSEREQGITIDVAYKYFTTRNRKYIITDAPGHFQYTKNLVTGASGVDAIIILIDARNGITEQTRRHLLVASFLRISQVAVAINKMDAVKYSEGVFESIKNDFISLAGKLNLRNITFIPVSALLGDNVSFPSENMGWYHGKNLLEFLEQCHPDERAEDNTGRFSVQHLIETNKPGFEKGYAGKILSGVFAQSEKIAIYPAGRVATIQKILRGYDEVPSASCGQNVVLYLDAEADAVRGNIFGHADESGAHSPVCSNRFEANICWLNGARPLIINSPYFLRINELETTCLLTRIVSKTDVHTFDEIRDEAPVEVNQFARVVIETAEPVVFDPFALVPANGRGIIIDAETNYTSAAFVI